MMPQLLFADRTGRIDLVAENKEGDLGELLDGKKRVKLGLGFSESLKVGTVDEKYNTVNFWEVVAPKTAGWKGKDVICVTGRDESDVTNLVDVHPDHRS